MILTYDQIRAVTTGAAEIASDGEFFGFHRFTTAQSECYKALRSVDFYNKTFATANVRLAFTTDSQTLKFSYKMENRGSSRKYAYIDVTVNGVLIGHFGGDSGDIAGVASLTLGGYTVGREKLVEICLPWSKAAWLAGVTLADGASLTPARRAKTMLCYGDSITHGYDAVYPSRSYTSRLSQMLGADAHNRAIGGDTFFPELLELDEPVTPDIVTVAYGTNDWNKHNAVHYARMCGEFYRRLSAKFETAAIYAITPLWRGDFEKETPFGAPAYETEALIRRCTESLPNVRVIPGWNLVPHDPGFMADKFLHPNDLGFAEYAQGLYAAIREDA